MHTNFDFMKQSIKVKTESRGLRMPEDLWAAMDKLAELDKRKTTQYLNLFLQELADKNKSKLKK